MHRRVICGLAVSCVAASLAAAVPGCSSGLVSERCFTPDSKFLIWRTLGYDCNDPVRRTDCVNGRTVTLGRGEFIPDTQCEYILIISWCARRDTPPAVLVRVTDGKTWRMPPLPKAIVERYGLWRTFATGLEVESGDDLLLSFNVVVDRDRNWAVSRHVYRSGSWEIADLAEGFAPPPDSSESLMPDRVLRDGHKSGDFTQQSPDGRAQLIEHVSEYGAHATLRTTKGRKVLLTMETAQGFELLRRTGEFIVYGGK